MQSSGYEVCDDSVVMGAVASMVVTMPTTTVAPPPIRFMRTRLSQPAMSTPTPPADINRSVVNGISPRAVSKYNGMSIIGE